MNENEYLRFHFEGKEGISINTLLSFTKCIKRVEAIQKKIGDNVEDDSLTLIETNVGSFDLSFFANAFQYIVGAFETISSLICIYQFFKSNNSYTKSNDVSKSENTILQGDNSSISINSLIINEYLNTQSVEKDLDDFYKSIANDENRGGVDICGGGQSIHLSKDNLQKLIASKSCRSYCNGERVYSEHMGVFTSVDLDLSKKWKFKDDTSNGSFEGKILDEEFKDIVNSDKDWSPKKTYSDNFIRSYFIKTDFFFYKM